MTVDLESLNPAQQRAVLHTDGPLLVVAGPGSGKTRVITHRIAYLIEQGVPAWGILGVTFTNAAAREMRTRIRTMTHGEAPLLSTFHGLGARIMREEHELLGVPEGFSIYDRDNCRTLIKRICKDLQIDTNFLRPSEVYVAISEAKNSGESPEQVASNAIGFKDEQIARIYESFQKHMLENGAFDFDDLLLVPSKILREHPRVRERYVDRFSHVLVDEYQDTNYVQYELTKLLAGQGNLFVVGDPDQSIYSWRGADLRNILDFEHDFPNAEVVVLGQNYRSTKVIVSAADHLVRNNQNRKAKELHTENEEGSAIRTLLTQSEEHEAHAMVSLIRDYIYEEGIAENEIAVFYRTNAQSRAIEQALIEASIPYLLVGSVEFFRRKEIQDVMAWLRLLINPNDEMAFQRAIQAPKRGVGATSITRIIEAARTGGMSLVTSAQSAQVQGSLRGRAKGGLAKFGEVFMRLEPFKGGPVHELISHLFAHVDFQTELLKDDPIKGTERWENVQELLTDAEKFDADNQEEGGATLTAYMEKVALISDLDAMDPNNKAVSLMSLHAAKGLEFDAVIIGGLEDNLIPHSRSIQTGPDEIEEERRLLYVGMTRARQHLVLTLAMNRMAMGQTMRNSPSRFLMELPQEHIVAQDLTGSSSLMGYRAGKAAGLFNARGKNSSDDSDIPFDITPESNDDFDIDQTAGDGDGESSNLWDDADTSPGLTRIDGGRSVVPEAKRKEGKVLGRGFFNEHPLNDRPADSPGGNAEIAAGDRVKHQMFGIGKVVSLTRHASGQRAKIMFEGWGEKNLALEFAKLEKLSP